jgi:hypothetical protein
VRFENAIQEEPMPILMVALVALGAFGLIGLLLVLAVTLERKKETPKPDVGKVA